MRCCFLIMACLPLWHCASGPHRTPLPDQCASPGFKSASGDTQYVDGYFNPSSKDQAVYYGFVNPLPNGLQHEVYFFPENCALKALFFRHPKNLAFFHGSRQQYFIDGAVEYEGRYDGGHKVGEHVAYHGNGKKKFSASIDSAAKRGRETYWHENGQKAMEGEVWQGYRIGFWKQWNTRGDSLPSLFNENDLTVREGLFNTDSILEAEFGMTFQKETVYFRYYSDQKNSGMIPRVDSILMANMDRMCKHLNYWPDKKIKIEIYNYKQDMARMSGWAGSMESLPVGIAFGPQKFRLLSYYNLSITLNFFRKTVVHEFNHVLLAGATVKRFSPPVWFAEGLAEYETGEKRLGDWSVQQAIKKEAVPTFSQLENEFRNADPLEAVKNYGWSSWIVEYMVEKYGWPTIQKYIRNVKEFEKVFGVSENEFYRDWVEYLRSKTE